MPGTWDEFMPVVGSKLGDLREDVNGMTRILDGARKAAGADRADCPAQVNDPLTFVAELARLGDGAGEAGRHRAFAWLAETFEVPFLAPDGFLGMFAPAPVDLSEVGAETLWKLWDDSMGVADARGLDLSPFGGIPRRAFVDILKKVLGASSYGSQDVLAYVSSALFLARPKSFLPLDGPVLDLLTSSDGLGIATDDLPVDAMDYLMLVQFLNERMSCGDLPYEDYLQMARAAAEGRTLGQGLSQSDRAALVLQTIRPRLARLWPHDDARVDAEVARLLAE